MREGTKLQSKDTHLPPALYLRVLHGDRCASETLQGVHVSRASWIAAWNVRAAYLTIISMKKKKKASGCVSYKTDTNWRGTRWQGIWLLEWYFSEWRILNRFRSLLEVFSHFFYHIWLNIFFPGYCYWQNVQLCHLFENNLMKENKKIGWKLINYFKKKFYKFLYYFIYKFQFGFWISLNIYERTFW